MLNTTRYKSRFIFRATVPFIATLFMLLSQTPCAAVTRGEMLGKLFSRLGYSAAQNPSPPWDVPHSHPFAKQIGSAVRYGLLPNDNFRPDDTVTRHEAIVMALGLMGWGFEVSLYESLASLPDLAGSGDPVFFLAAEIDPPAPSGLLVDPRTPLSDTGLSSLLSWVGQCRKYVRWNQVFSYGGADLIIYRQGVARPGEPNPSSISGNPVGSGMCEPLYVAAIAVTPSAADQHIAFAEPLGRASITPSDFAFSYDAIGVVNGGFFSQSRPIGTMLVGGTHVGKPLAGRSAVGWNPGGMPVFGGGDARVGIMTPAGFVDFTRFNAPPDPNGAALYTSSVTETTSGVGLDALEIVIRNGAVAERRESSMSDKRTPAEGVLIAARGNSRRLLEHLTPGDPVDIRTDWKTRSLGDCLNLIQAGPMLMENARFIVDSESFKSDLLDKRHPRTIMGTDGKRSFWAVIDGRSALHSRGATIEETRWVAKSLGLSSAINMDGGGSSQLVWRGILVNSPSDGKERPLPYAIIITPRGEKLVKRNIFTPASGAEAFGAGSAEFGEPLETDRSPAPDSGVWMETYNPYSSSTAAQ